MDFKEENRVDGICVTDGEKKHYAYLTELLENQFLVVTNPGLESEEIDYMGENELEAHKRLKSARRAYKRLYRANVQMMEWEGLDSVPFIHSYEIIEELA